MAGEGGRRGRRDNGLDAASYVPLVDVDPRVGEHLLDVLGSAGVPAYLEPSVDVEPYTRAMSLPSPPTDRLFVDREQRTQAREIVEAETPHGTRPRPQPRDDVPSHGLTDQEEERAWQAIIAGFDAAASAPTLEARGHYLPEPDTDPGPAPTPPPPAAPTGGGDVLEGGSRAYRDREDLIADPWSDTEPTRRRRTRGGPADTDPLPSGKDLDKAAEARAKSEANEAEAADDIWIDGPPTLDDGTEEHFEPPPPPPVPRPSRHTVFAVLLLALGILFMAVPDRLGLDDRTGLTLGVVSVLAGGVLLVLRLRETRVDDGPDDGAIV